ncbi:AAA family ATPase [Crocosphaera sp. XPORK-15E]|uniref:AAA family ATPase n=1 Tax=Crocosphaera sp. XPORK-15E TaxID=3110247 RepID=UPI002B209ABB|nr:AAA family ATPase [Crocosphaera sp. XPORK-15E]MEA5536573.1 AAA family ATPase [Crocosphaera sp. XPORK-15E]
MKVKSLKMKSFRGFKDVTIKFNPDSPTVFIGVNGAGKSTILDCLAILLSRYTSLVLSSPAKSSN